MYAIQEQNAIHLMVPRVSGSCGNIQSTHSVHHSHTSPTAQSHESISNPASSSHTMTLPNRNDQPPHPSEDSTPTTPLELSGWYSYNIAAEVFTVCGVGSFLPVTLEQLARENGVLWTDRTTPCFPPTGSQSGQCLVRYLGREMTTASFAMYSFSAAVGVQALVLVSFSAFADRGAARKALLLAFAWLGAVVAMGFLAVTPPLYWAAPFMVVLAVSCMGSSFVILNSVLPLLAKNHPEVGGKRGGEGEAVLVLSTRISSNGVGLGYAAAVFVQCLSIVILVLMNKFLDLTESKTLPLRFVLFVAGAWWAVFTVPAALWLRKRPGPPLDSHTVYASRLRRYFAYVCFAWVSLWRTIKVALQLKQAALFLVAWFLLSDAVATVSGTAILFARTELNMGTVPIALLSITATTSGIAGAILWPKLSKHYRWPTNKTIVACVMLMEIIPLYGLVGFLPFVQRWGVGGLQQAWEIYPLAVIHGTVMGGISSYCRSFYGLLIPPGSEVAFYALYAITDKGSSAIGPAVVGRIVDTTGHIRPAFVFLAVLVVLPMPMIWAIDVDRGQADAQRMAERLRMINAYSTGVELRSDDEDEAEGLIQDSHNH